MKIVMYHYVRKPDASLPYFNFLHIDDFKKQLDYFQQQSGILSPQAVYDALAGVDIPEGFVLTFDDGLRDHYEFVFPELQQRGLQGFFFISTGWYKHQRMLHVHQVHLLLGRFGGAKILSLLQQLIQPGMISESQQAHFASFTYPNQQNDEATLTVKQLLNFYLKTEYLSSIIQQLFELTGVDEKLEGKQYYLSVDELQQMQKAGMVIGSHTENHPVLSKLSKEEQAQEIGAGTKDFSSLLSLQKPESFCYPYGYGGTFNNDSLQVLKQHNYSCAFMVDARDATATDLLEHPYQLPRYDCNFFPHGKVWKP